jgi:hypothetical protein
MLRWTKGTTVGWTLAISAAASRDGSTTILLSRMVGNGGYTPFQTKTNEKTSTVAPLQTAEQPKPDSEEVVHAHLVLYTCSYRPTQMLQPKFGAFFALQTTQDSKLDNFLRYYSV